MTAEELKKRNKLLIEMLDRGTDQPENFMEVTYLINRNGMLRDFLRRSRLALIEVQGYLPTTYLTLVSEIDESGLLK